MTKFCKRGFYFFFACNPARKSFLDCLQLLFSRFVRKPFRFGFHFESNFNEFKLPIFRPR